jgi:hypothetical protein
VDELSNQLRFVVAGKQADSDVFSVCEGYHRQVEVAPPNPADPQRPWIPISPVSSAGGLTPPSNWSIRNGVYDDVLLVSNPDPGTWQIRTRYYYQLCRQGQLDAEATKAELAAAPTALESDFMMDASVQSNIRLEGRFLGLDMGQGQAGDMVPVIGTLMGKGGLIPGATVIAAIQNEGGTDYIPLLDDGAHQDGQPNDGIYGWKYTLTNHGGSYGVRMVASFPNPNKPSQTLTREWNGGFWIDGPQIGDQTNDNDSDGDGLPDDYEKRFPCLDPEKPDSTLDPDKDGLPSISEFQQYGTNPCRADTDRGGERDGSEVQNKRNPLRPEDDKVRPIGRLELRPLNNAIWINWTPVQTQNLKVFISTVPGELGNVLDLGNSGQGTIDALPGGGAPTNGTPYYLTFAFANSGDGAEGAYSDQDVVTPKEDPVPPSGAFNFGGPNVIAGGDIATSPQVTLLVDATDQPSYEGAASHSVPHAHFQTPGLVQTIVSGNIEMRFHNDAALIELAPWEPLADEKPWTLACTDGEYCSVFAQFRDGAGNESLVVEQSIKLQSGGAIGPNKLFLPLITK